MWAEMGWGAADDVGMPATARVALNFAARPPSCVLTTLYTCWRRSSQLGGRAGRSL